jgi:transposase
MSDTFSKVEVITGVARRRRFSTEQKLAIVAETMQPGTSISYIARRHGLSPSLVFRWRQLMSEGGKQAVNADDDVVGAGAARRPSNRVRRAWACVTTWRLGRFATGRRNALRPLTRTPARCVT